MSFYKFLFACYIVSIKAKIYCWFTIMFKYWILFLRPIRTEGSFNLLTQNGMY